MKVSLRNKFTQQLVVIQTTNDDPDGSASMEFDGDATTINEVKRELDESYGFYGHINRADKLTNLDLLAAVQQLPSFTPLLPLPAIEPSSIPSDTIT